MQRIWIGVFGFWLLAAQIPAAPAKADCALRYAYDFYGVYSYTDDHGNPAGVDVDLINAVAEDIGCAASAVEMPWARVLLALENGEIDITSSASKTPERLEFAYFSEPYRNAQVAIFVRRGESERFRLASLSDIPASGFHLGIVNGYYYGPEFETLMHDSAFAGQVDGAVDYETNIRKLLLGRIDGFLVDDVGVMVSAIRTLGVENDVEQHPLAISGDEFHLMFSRKSVDTALIEAVDQSLARMAADGHLDRIINKHLE
jgi:polar amino acid transport system substrate-binding protein